MKHLLFCLLFWSCFSPAVTPVRLHGTLVTEPCTLEPDQEQLELDFGDVIAKSLYSVPRSPARPVSLTLTGCDDGLGQVVEVSFSGNADTEQPDLLMLDGSATAKGVAIGISDQQGNTVPINRGTLRFPLQKGINTLKFMAWLQASPDAIQQRKVEAGSVTAIATFYLTYP